jgi:hypothetical protein
MTGLKELQDSFQRAIVEGDDAVLAEIVDTSKEKRDVLLGVYRNAYVLRLIEFLQNDYEKLHTLLGDDQFDEMARAYIAANPSDTPNARWYGRKLPDFLRGEAPWSGTPLLADLAALEQGLNDAFDAADAPALSLEDLGTIAPEDWPGLTFTPHPAARRIDVATNAVDVWQALNAEETPRQARRLSDPSVVVIYRNDGMASFRAMAADEAMMWDEAVAGVTFSVLCEMLAAFAGEDEAPARAAGYLKGWIDAGMLAAPAGTD